MTATPCGESLIKTFERNSQRTAVVWDGGTLSYGELIEESRRLAGWFASHGLTSGGVVATALPNGVAYLVAYFACLFGGYAFVPVNTDLSDSEKAYLVERSGAQLVLNDVGTVMGANATAHATEFPSNLDAGCVFFTSGTTGRPKGVVHRVENLLSNAHAFNAAAGIDETVRMYHTLPMGYIAGFLNTVLCPMVAGGTVLLGPKLTPLTALDFWSPALEWGANATWLTPTMAALLCRLARDVDSAARVGSAIPNIYCGTAPLHDRVREDFRRVFRRPLRESYGMSEVLLVSVQTSLQAETEPGAGALLAGVELGSRNVDGYELPELLIRTPWMLDRYLTEDGETSPLTSDGEMPSGDVATLVDGQLVITGRLKDLIIRGGINISPKRIETVIMEEEGVAECAVVGLPDDFWGEVAIACVVAAADSPPNLAERLRSRCLLELGEGMRPDRYEFLTSLPKSVTGKVAKAQLRANLRTSSRDGDPGSIARPQTGPDPETTS